MKLCFKEQRSIGDIRGDALRCVRPCGRAMERLADIADPLFFLSSLMMMMMMMSTNRPLYLFLSAVNGLKQTQSKQVNELTPVQLVKFAKGEKFAGSFSAMMDAFKDLDLTDALEQVIGGVIGWV
jgi:hypothetical protein